MGGSLAKKGGSGFHDINMTPLVDVMLVLLVVFMVTAPLLATGLKVELPKVEATNTPVPDEALVVSITRDEKVFFGETEVKGALGDVLAHDARVSSTHKLFIRADKDTRYEAVAHAVSEARAAGVTSLNLLVEPEPRRP
jgi:biopolymer transport protein TolR